ncbi:TylF/MycF/NovP-related O-methyltransferase [Aridibaculum aurantiacum]|uniref:TylF/MycF/NovP-related O-methyltransferase n=1 Tax=Aridibaculum aurantiacum TaxID=2810307 RepID=UPI001A957DE4|nr:TylF/MycF/NovP-related O-methyltransferase [Aridibaculum aurantiacum]
MKSFVAFPSDKDKVLLPLVTPRNKSGKLLAHVEIYKQVASLNGSIVKCGIAAEEGFVRFMALKQAMKPSQNRHMIAFEKFSYTNQHIPDPLLNLKIKNVGIAIKDNQQAMMRKANAEDIEFIPGHVDDSIAAYLIENPELKISYLNIDLDNYEMTTTSLEFFYPRLVLGGVIIFDNYHKQQEEYKAVRDYFFGKPVSLNCFSPKNGPYYLYRH